MNFKNSGKFPVCDLRQLYDMENIDYENRFIPEEVAPYAKEIFKNLLKEEKRYIPTAGYMKNQVDINYKMRAILVDWLVDVCLKFKLIPETLFLTVNLIDRYLER